VLPIFTVACVLHTCLVFDELSVGVGTLPLSVCELGMLGLGKGSAIGSANGLVERYMPQISAR